MRYFEDFVVGERIELGEYTVSEEEILHFARQYDPQHMHVDKSKAEQTEFGSLIASGWHTASIFMRLQTDAFLQGAATLASPGVDELRWLAPVRPGDTLSGQVDVLEARPSRSKPDRGLIICAAQLHNQGDEAVLSLRTLAFFRRRAV